MSTQPTQKRQRTSSLASENSLQNMLGLEDLDDLASMDEEDEHQEEQEDFLEDNEPQGRQEEEEEEDEEEGTRSPFLGAENRPIDFKLYSYTSARKFVFDLFSLHRRVNIRELANILFPVDNVLHNFQTMYDYIFRCLNIILTILRNGIPDNGDDECTTRFHTAFKAVEVTATMKRSEIEYINLADYPIVDFLVVSSMVTNIYRLGYGAISSSSRNDVLNARALIDKYLLKQNAQIDEEGVIFIQVTGPNGATRPFHKRMYNDGSDMMFSIMNDPAYSGLYALSGSGAVKKDMIQYCSTSHPFMSPKKADMGFVCFLNGVLDLKGQQFVSHNECKVSSCFQFIDEDFPYTQERLEEIVSIPFGTQEWADLFREECPTITGILDHQLKPIERGQESDIGRHIVNNDERTEVLLAIFSMMGRMQFRLQDDAFQFELVFYGKGGTGKSCILKRCEAFFPVGMVGAIKTGQSEYATGLVLSKMFYTIDEMGDKVALCSEDLKKMIGGDQVIYNIKNKHPVTKKNDIHSMFLGNSLLPYITAEEEWRRRLRVGIFEIETERNESMEFKQRQENEGPKLQILTGLLFGKVLTESIDLAAMGKRYFAIHFDRMMEATLAIYRDFVHKKYEAGEASDVIGKCDLMAHITIMYPKFKDRWVNIENDVKNAVTRVFPNSLRMINGVATDYKFIGVKVKSFTTYHN